MADLEAARKYALKAKAIFIGRGMKGFFLPSNDFSALLNALTEEQEEEGWEEEFYQ